MNLRDVFSSRSNAGGSVPGPEAMLSQLDPMMQQQMPMDPLSAAQLSRPFGDEGAFFGIANLTIDNKKIIEEFRARLRGYELKRRVDEGTGKELAVDKVKFGEPIMNDDGINHMCGLLESALSKSIMLSNFPEKMHRHIVTMTRVFYRTVAVQIAVNSEKWNVDRTRRDSLPYEMSILLYTNFMRAYEDGERRKLYPGQRSMTTMNLMAQQPLQQQEKRGLMGLW